MAYAKIEPSGCEIRKNRLKLRVDCYLEDTDPHYDKTRLLVVDETTPEFLAGYPGDPEDTEAYLAWLNGLPHIWITRPFHSHFLHPDSGLNNTALKNEIKRVLAYFYAFHQYCWDGDKRFIDEWQKVSIKTGEVRCPFVVGELSAIAEHEVKLAYVLAHLGLFTVAMEGDAPPDLRIEERGTIDIGPGATDLSNSTFISNYTIVDSENPANASGSLDFGEIQVTSKTGSPDVWLGTFYYTGGAYNYKCRDSESCGGVTSGYNDFTGLSIDVETDDLLGVHAKAGSVLMDRETSGGTAYYYFVGECIDPNDEETFDRNIFFLSAIGATGEEAGAITLELRSSTDTDARIALDTEISLALRSSSGTAARLTLNTSVGLALRSSLGTDARLALDTEIALELRSSTGTRAAITLTVAEVTELELRSSSDTAARIDLDTGIALALRSTTATAARISLAALIALALRSSSDTRADMGLDTAVTLELRSSTGTDARIELTIPGAPTELVLRSTTATATRIALDTTVSLVIRSSTASRATVALNMAIALALRSSSATRASITLDTLISLTLRSSSDTRAAISLSTVIALALRSSTATRAVIALTVAFVTELELRSATATRAAITLNTLITLVLLSRTATRAAITLEVAYRYMSITMDISGRTLSAAVPGRSLGTWEVNQNG